MEQKRQNLLQEAANKGLNVLAFVMVPGDIVTLRAVIVEFSVDCVDINCQHQILPELSGRLPVERPRWDVGV